MKMVMFFLMLSFSINCFSSPASEDTIEELFEITQTQKMMDSIYAQMDGVFAQMVQGMNITEKQKPIMDVFFKKYNALIKQEMSWDKLKGPLSKVYSSVYTEGEVREIIEFYKSPVGQKMLVKMPELMQASMSITQDVMKGMMPKISQLQKELQEELQGELKNNINNK